MILLRFGALDSTQSFLRRHPELGDCAVLAAAQSEGRGRWGNRWESLAGAGLFLSASMRDPELPPGIALQRAMLHVIACLGSPLLGLKWPNDLVAWNDGRLVKVGGVIGELVGSRLLLGLGVNLAAAPELGGAALPPTSLSALGLSVPDPEQLALRILAAWEGLPPAPEPGFCWPAQGEAIQWQDGQGVVLGWEKDGRLRLANQLGIQRLGAGEIIGLRSGE